MLNTFSFLQDIPAELFSSELEFFGMASTMEEINETPDEDELNNTAVRNSYIVIQTDSRIIFPLS